MWSIPKKSDYRLSDNRSKLNEKENAFGYCQNNNNECEKDKDGNASDDDICVDNLTWGDIGKDFFITDIPDHYCDPHGFKEFVKKIFQNVLE